MGGIQGDGRESLIPTPNFNTAVTDLVCKDLLKITLTQGDVNIVWSVSKPFFGSTDRNTCPQTWMTVTCTMFDTRNLTKIVS